MAVPILTLGPEAASAALRSAGAARGGLVGVAVRPGSGAGLAVGTDRFGVADTDVADTIRRVEAELRPRWVWWNQSTAAALIGLDLRPATCWDVAAVHRVLFGGWRAEPARVWAVLHGRSAESIPELGQLGLFAAANEAPADGDESDPDEPTRPDGHLRPEWVAGDWHRDPTHVARWAGAALEAAALQEELLRRRPEPMRAAGTARSESAAELLCAELAADGLPVSLPEAERLIASFVGPRPRTESEAAASRAARDAEVLRFTVGEVDLRNPAHVKNLLRREGIDLPDTRAWRLEALRDEHPIVAALLEWRKAERIATTFGYGWLDERVGADGRLRGEWSGSDGAAGRMTAQAGLHNLPAELRSAVRADAGHVFVRADLGQIEPRVLAAVSGDQALARATQADDLYAPVAKRLAVERSVAKVAVLAAMYGQTSGAAGRALHGLEQAYPVAMDYLRAADEAGRQERDVMTSGGRLIRTTRPEASDDPSRDRSIANAYGRFARNAVVQGAAAELFKVWAVTVRTRLAGTGGRIVLCLHDELLVHVPAAAADTAAAVVADGLQEAAARWSPDPGVRFVVDLSVVERWSDAKDPAPSRTPADEAVDR